MSERLTTFLKNVTDFAGKECEDLTNRAQSFKNDSISSYKKDAQAKTDSFTQYEISRILSRVNGEISAYESARRAELTELRSEITDKVFSQAAEKIADFTDSAEYESFLKKSAVRLNKAVGGDGVVFLVRSADMKYADMLRECAEDAEVREDGSIRFGGLKATDKAALICGDDTLDMRMEACRRQFSEKSELKIY